MSDASEAILSDAQPAALAVTGDEVADAGETLLRAGDAHCLSAHRDRREGARSPSSTRPGSRSRVTARRAFSVRSTCCRAQAVFVTAVATQPLRYVAVERARLLLLMTEDASLSDVLLATFVRRR